METKVKTNKWDLIKPKSFCIAKQTINTMKDKLWTGRKYLQMIWLTRDEFSKYTKSLYISIKKKNNFSKENTQMASRHRKRCSLSVIIRETQIKTTMRYQLIPVRMAIIQTSPNNKCWNGCGEKGSVVHCWWECRLVQPLWKTVSVQFSRSVVSDSMKVLQRLKMRLTIWYSKLTLWHISRENHNWKTFPNVHCNTIYNS